MSTNISPFSKPKYVMLKPAGAACNMRCDYCYYLEKKNLYQQQRRQILSEDMLEKFVEQYMNIQTTPSVLFTWHGGEPLLRLQTNGPVFSEKTTSSLEYPLTVLKKCTMPIASPSKGNPLGNR